MLFLLSLIPVAGLLVFIYFNDKKEKEPFGLLVALFFAGMGTVVTAVISEVVCDFILNLVIPIDTVPGAILSAMAVVAPAEEMGKFLILWLITWKNKHFNYSYDAIVYAVFVSLGFAALENITYVFDNGIGTAFMRMVTAVPGHACFAVFMGFFFSRAKYAALTGKKKKCAMHILLSMFMPIITHGVYDAILMGGEATGEDLLTGLSFLLWLGYITALFVVSVIFIIRSSRNDFCIVTLPEQTEKQVQVQVLYRPSVAGSWTCACGAENNLNFCFKCGRQRPVNTTWRCATCGALSAYNFCGNCGNPRPFAPASTQIPGAQIPGTQFPGTQIPAAPVNVYQNPQTPTRMQ